MVDDVLCVARCSSEAVQSVATINAFMELNKLKLASKKCAKIHIGKKKVGSAQNIEYMNTIYRNPNKRNTLEIIFLKKEH